MLVDIFLVKLAISTLRRGVPFMVKDQPFTVFDESNETKLGGENARLYYEGGE